MNKVLKIFLYLLLIISLSLSLVSCSSDGVVYKNIDTFNINEASIADGFLLSEFDISKVKIDIKYKDTTDANGAVVVGETLQIPATISMVIAEDKAELSISGSKTVTLVYGKFKVSFILKLFDDSTPKYKVEFYSDDGITLLGDIQYVDINGKAIEPDVPTKLDYDFLGWKDKDTNLFSSFDSIVKNTTFIAYYAAKTYSVTYYSNILGVSTELGKASVPRGGNALDYAPNIPIIQGYSNGRWENTDSMDNVSQNGLTFNAIYDQDSVIVTFNYKKYDALSVDDFQSYHVNDVIQVTNNTFDIEKDGYKFIGWFNESGKAVVFPYTVTNEMRFVAKYIEISKGNGGLSYKLINSNTEYIIDGYNDAENIVVIPDKYNGINVTGITAGIFNSYDIKEFVVSSTNAYFKVDDGVLYDIDNTLLAYPTLKTESSFSINDDCIGIADYAFSNAKNLTAIDLGYKIKTIGKEAFKNCTLITEIIIPATVEEINAGAFKMTKSSALTSITFGASSLLTKIDNEVFYGLNNLLSIDIPSYVSTIGSGVFYGCKSLANISVAENNIKFIIENGGLYDIDKTILYCYPANYSGNNITDLVLPSTVNTIYTGAFSYTKLQGICITSDTITLESESIISPNIIYLRILSNVFNYQTQSFDDYIPRHIYVENSNVYDDIYANLTTNVEIFDNDNWVELLNFVNDYMYAIERVTVIENNISVEKTTVTILGKRSTVEILNIPDIINNYDVTKIADYAFAEDNNIKSVNLPNALTSIGNYAFANIPNLSILIMNANINTIGYRAFYGCSKLSRVEYDSLTEITSLGVEAFTKTAWYDSESQKYLTINSLLVKFNGYDISATIAQGIKNIASDAFGKKTNLTSVKFNSNVLETIGYRAFQFCTGISSITLPNSILKIEKEAFYNCSNLLLVNIDTDKANSGNIVIDSTAFPLITSIRYKTSDTSYTLYYKIDESETKSEIGTIFVNPITIADDANNKFGGWYTTTDFIDLVKFPLTLTDDNTTQNADIRSMTIYAKFIPATEGSSGLKYQLNDDSGYTITDYTGSDLFVIVPQKYKGKNVNAVADNAFANAANVTNINLPYGTVSTTGITYSYIKLVGKNVFDNTVWFKNYLGDFVIINDILIKYKGFASIVEIPTSITKIAAGAFYQNTFITKVVIPEGITVIGNDMFNGCINLESVILPSTIISIGDGAFAGCTKLNEINFNTATALSSISSSALNGTEWIKNCTDNCIIINDILYKYQKVEGQGATTDGKLTIMNGITQIADRAFENDISLKQIYIPQSMELIGKYAFAGSHINEVKIFAGGSKLINIKDYAFSDCINLSNINISVCSLLYTIGAFAFSNTSNLYCDDNSSMTIPASVAVMGEGVFDSSAIVNVKFETGSKLKEIPIGAFKNCTNLSSIFFDINSILTVIGESAFYECSTLSIFINQNASIVEIAAKAFYNCIYLKRIDINSVKLQVIGTDALYNMGYVNNFNSNLVEIGNILIKYQGSDAEVEIPSNITTIYDEAFSGSTNLTKITFAQNSKLTTINNKAFYNCSSLENISFPSTITSVGVDVMTNTVWYNNQVRDGVEFITIGNTLIKYNGEAKQVTIPSTVTKINKDAFNGVELYNITIGEQVTAISEGAFNGIIRPDISYVKGNFVLISCMDTTAFTAAGKNSLTTYGSSILYYEIDTVNNIYTIASAFIDGITDYYMLNSNIDNTCKISGNWSITLLKAKPFEIGINTIPKIYLASSVAKEDYLLDTRWDIYENIFDVVNNYAVTLSLDAEKAAEINNFDSTMIYDEIGVLASFGNVFIGWYLDSDCATPIHYPLILNKNLIIYAKFVSYDIGTEGGFSRESIAEVNYIVSYNNYVDATIVIPTIVAGYTFDKISGYWSEADAANGKYGTHAWSDITNQYEPIEEQYATHYYTGAFEGHTELETVYFANNSKITTIGKYAFRNCTSLRKIVLPSSITTIEEGAFIGCTNLKEVIFTYNSEVTITIATNAFKNCSSLKSITFPANISNLATNAFAGCTSLVDIYMTDTAEITICLLSGATPFDDNDGKLKIYVVTAVYNGYSERWAAYKDYLVEVKDEE